MRRLNKNTVGWDSRTSIWTKERLLRKERLQNLITLAATHTRLISCTDVCVCSVDMCRYSAHTGAHIDKLCLSLTVNACVFVCVCVCVCVCTFWDVGRPVWDRSETCFEIDKQHTVIGYYVHPRLGACMATTCAFKLRHLHYLAWASWRVPSSSDIIVP